MNFRTTILLLGALCSACANQSPRSPDQTSNSNRLERLAGAQCPPAMQPGTLVLNEQQRAALSGAANDLFIAMRARPRPTSGYRIVVTLDSDTADQPILIFATTQPPPTGTMQAQVITHPCAVVRIKDGKSREIVVDDPTGELSANFPPAR